MDLLSNIPNHEATALPFSISMPSTSIDWTPKATSSTSSKPSPSIPPTPTVQSAAPPSFLPWSPLLCDCVKLQREEVYCPLTGRMKTSPTSPSEELIERNQALVQNGQELYEWHQRYDKAKCTWFIRAKKAQADRMTRQYEQREARQLKELAKQQRAIEEAACLVKKQAEGYTCRRCKGKFDSNTKLHEHVRTKHAKKSKSSALTSPPSPPPASPPSSPSATSIEPPALPASTPPATPPATPRIPISWAEAASRSTAAPAKPSRIPRPTITTHGLPTAPPSPILPSCLANHVTRPPPLAAAPVKPHLTVEDLYARFHEESRPEPESKPLSFSTRQIRLRSAPTSGRQMRITAYFKSDRKHTNMEAHCHTNLEAHGHTNDSDVTRQKTRNWKLIARPLTDFQKPKNSANQNARRPSFSFEVNQSECSKFKASASHLGSAYSCRRCKQRFILKDLFYRHLRHCSPCTRRWPPANSLTFAGKPTEGLNIQRLWSPAVEGFSMQSPALRPTQMGELQFQHQCYPAVHMGESPFQYYPALLPASTNALIGGALNTLPPPHF
ncbi:MAG: hypothetical protein HETSPECPRED_000266 [Heterodermia speciosa]|uniref:C2H2-type domain-containing protein n=1 Tax=Heterodermia speciosa TaxID=116794 RepID=A0A8H3IEX9_9LECA|nr:MAG: hypothetical protein HETSPECPRED_000266 [Heterodermia speciosa]